MSIKIANLNKNIFEKLELNIKNGEFVNLICEDQKETSRIFKILKGKAKKNDNSDTFYNDQMVLNKVWVKRNVKFIENKKISNIFINPKQRLFFRLYFDPDFYKLTKERYLNSKYEYLNFKNSDGIELIYDLRKDIDNIINDFVESSTKIELKWLEDFHKYITKFVNDKINNESFSEDIKNILRDYFSLLEQKNNLIIYERFMQGLWDQIFDMSDIDFSCNCLINYKKNKSNKDSLNKWRIKYLGFEHQKISVEKNLKIIDNNIKFIRRSINKINLTMSTLRTLVANKIRITREFSSNKKLFKHINSWVELATIQRNEFSSKQDKIVYETLQSEGGNIKGKIIEIIHHFHNKVLKSEGFIIDLEDYSEETTLKKKKVKGISSNIWEWINKEFSKYHIKMNVLSISPSSLNYVYINIISSIFAKKNNIILQNVLSQLTDNEKIDFFNTLKIIIANNPNLTFLFIETSYKSVLEYDRLIYWFDKESWISSNAKDLFIENKKILLEVFSGYNKLKLSNIKGRLLYNGDKIDIDNNIIGNKKNIILNPFLLNKTKTSKGKIEVFITSNNTTTDNNIHIATSKNGDKICFYREENYKPGEKVKIYYDESSIV